MNRKEFVRRVAASMRDKEIRKIITMPKQTFHISDDEGNTKDFIVKKSDKGVLFTIDDIEVILDACINEIEEALRHGDNISIRGFGTIGLRHRKARKTLHPNTGEPVDVAERYVPKFTFGNDLRMCARVFGLSQEELGVNQSLLYEESD